MFFVKMPEIRNELSRKDSLFFKARDSSTIKGLSDIIVAAGVNLKHLEAQNISINSYLENKVQSQVTVRPKR